MTQVKQLRPSLVSIFYCQTNTDNGSDTSYIRTRSSLLHINHK